MSNRLKAYEALESLREKGVQDSQILDYIVNNHLTGDAALDAVNSAAEEFCPSDESDEEESETLCGVCGGDASICDGC